MYTEEVNKIALSINDDKRIPTFENEMRHVMLKKMNHWHLEMNYRHLEMNHWHLEMNHRYLGINHKHLEVNHKSLEIN